MPTSWRPSTPPRRSASSRSTSRSADPARASAQVPDAQGQLTLSLVDEDFRAVDPRATIAESGLRSGVHVAVTRAATATPTGAALSPSGRRRRPRRRPAGPARSGHGIHRPRTRLRGPARPTRRSRAGTPSSSSPTGARSSTSAPPTAILFERPARSTARSSSGRPVPPGRHRDRARTLLGHRDRALVGSAGRRCRSRARRASRRSMQAASSRCPSCPSRPGTSDRPGSPRPPPLLMGRRAVRRCCTTPSSCSSSS